MKDVVIKFGRIEYIEHDCNLAKLFNHAIRHLERVRIVSAPIDFFQKDGTRSEQIVMFYESCLWELYLHGVVNKLETWKNAINEYLGEYNGSWKYYASSKRLDSIREHGGEPEDFDENGEIRTEGLTDNELEGYTLKYDLDDQVRNAAISAYPRNLESMFYMLIGFASLHPIEIINMALGSNLKQYKQDEEGNMVEMTFAEKAQQKAMNQTSMDDLVKILVAVVYEFRSLVQFIENVPSFEDYKDELTDFNMKVINLMNLNFKMSDKAEKFYQRIIETSDK